MKRRRHQARVVAVNERAKTRTWVADTRPLWVRVLTWLGMEL